MSTIETERELILGSRFSGRSGETIDLEIQIPRRMNVAVNGASLEVEILGAEGTVSVTNTSGKVTVLDALASVRVTSTRGEIVYRSRIQPNADLRLETETGAIQCELARHLNLRASLQAGAGVRWPDLSADDVTSVSAEIGSAGPLLEAVSVKGGIRVLLAGDEAHAPRLPAESAPRHDVRRAAAPRTTEPAVQPRPSIDDPDRHRPAGTEQGIEIKVAVNTVLLNVSVRERDTNRNVPGLRQEDFAIYEDGVEQTIDQLLPEHSPFSLLLLLDTSESTQYHIRLIRKSAIEFIRRVSDRDRIAVASFNTGVRLLQEFTNDRKAAEENVGRIKPGGGTAFYDALRLCLGRFMRGVIGRKAIVVFTDGVDNAVYGLRSQGSRIRFENLYNLVAESECLIYTIFLDSEGASTALASEEPAWLPPGAVPFPFPHPRGGSPRQDGAEAAAYKMARLQLESIAEQTGGRMYSPKRAADLSKAYQEVADDLRSQYLLSYTPSDSVSRGWRLIEVRLKDKPDLAARTRKGYYAPRMAPGSR